MPKVLIVIARLNVGGTAQYINELTHGLIARGYDVLVATGHVQGAEIEDGVVNSLPIHRIPSMGRKISFASDLKARRELRELIDTFKPDLIYSHTFKAGALTRSIKRAIPRIHAFHGHLLAEPELAGWRAQIVVVIERILAKKAVALVTVGAKVAEELLAKKVGSPHQYRPIAPGVHALQLEGRDVARAALGIADETRPIVVWMARVTAVKAPQRVAQIARAIPEAHFLLAGGGDLLSEISRDTPENLTVLGWQPATRMWAVADLAISTSENEGMPVALIEAQLAGIPVVAIDVGSVSEVIDDHRTGFVLPSFGSDFIECTRELVTSSQLRHQYGAAAVEHAEAEFKPERLLNSHLALFTEILRK